MIHEFTERNSTVLSSLQNDHKVELKPNQFQNRLTIRTFMKLRCAAGVLVLTRCIKCQRSLYLMMPHHKTVSLTYIILYKCAPSFDCYYKYYFYDLTL